jgi:glycosyltransferase involved in cell wall biosynthesis
MGFELRRDARPTICLNMIVKNEAHVLRRCLSSVLPFIDCWVIVDTGSTDDTREVVREVLARLPGDLHERPWRDFGTNRTEALELARSSADYTLVIDADEVLIPDTGFRMPTLTADGYQIRHAVGDMGTSFQLIQLVKSRLPWRYEGVLHEVLTCDANTSIATLDGLVTKGFFDSARNRSPVEKYRSDAAILEAALGTDPRNARYAFYLAQSYRDAGEYERAIDWYRRRIEMGGWDEEVWYSMYQLAQLLERSGAPWPAALDAYLTAYQFRPRRAETLCGLAAHYRAAGQYATALLFAGRAVWIPRPNDILFLDESIYAWRALDEYAIASFYAGDVEEALRGNQRLLAEGSLPESERLRVERNLAFCREKHRVRVQADRTHGKQKRRRR